MAITSLPTPPTRGDPANFAQRGDAFMAALPTFATQANTLQADVTAKQATASAAANAAGTSKDAAAGSASASAASAAASEVSAAAATTQAATATTRANTSTTRASEASASAATAATQATTATNQAAIATSKASEAAGSRDAASGSATAAANSAAASLASSNTSTASKNAAATSETNAASSASSAATSKSGSDTALASAIAAKNAAETALDSFDDRYLGSKSVVPTLDNDGAAILTGALYWDSVLNGGCLRVRQAGAWVTIPANIASTITTTPAGGLVATNVQAALNELDLKKAIASDVSNANYPTIRPSLNLDFAGSQSVDPRITFVRASSASYFDATGIMRYAASGEPRIDFDPVTGECKGWLIEEARTNLLAYSEDFANSAWSKTRIAVTPLVSGCLIVSSAEFGTHDLTNASSQISTDGLTFTAFADVKDAGQRYVWLRIVNRGGSFRSVGFDLQLGQYSIISGEVTGSIVPLGDEVYRCTITLPVGSGSNTASGRLTISGSSAIINGEQYAGDGVKGFILYRAQNELGSFPTSYIRSVETFSSRASGGTFISSDGTVKNAENGVARMQYNPMNLGVAPKLLLEDAATNIIPQSTTFGAFTSQRAVVTFNQGIAPDGSNSAAKFSNNGVVDSNGYMQYAFDSNGSSYAGSIFAKKGEISQIQLDFVEPQGMGFTANARAVVDLNSGRIETGNGNSAIQVTALPNGWFRIGFSGTPASGASASMRISLPNDSTNSRDGFFIWGPQIEAGNYATSYIPTTSSSTVTRAADVSNSAQATRSNEQANMTGKNFTDWYRQYEGSLVASFTSGYDLQSTRIVQLSDGIGSLNNIGLLGTNSGGTGPYGQVSLVRGSQATMTDGNETVLTKHIAALAYKTDSVAFVRDGRAVQVDTSADIPVVTMLTLGADVGGDSGHLNGHIAKLTYFPKRLSNETLQAITA